MRLLQTKTDRAVLNFLSLKVTNLPGVQPESVTQTPVLIDKPRCIKALLMMINDFHMWNIQCTNLLEAPLQQFVPALQAQSRKTLLCEVSYTKC